MEIDLFGGDVFDNETLQHGVVDRDIYREQTDREQTDLLQQSFDIRDRGSYNVDDDVVETLEDYEHAWKQFLKTADNGDSEDDSSALSSSCRHLKLEGNLFVGQRCLSFMIENMSRLPVSQRAQKLTMVTHSVSSNERNIQLLKDLLGLCEQSLESLEIRSHTFSREQPVYQSVLELTIRLENLVELKITNVNAIGPHLNATFASPGCKITALSALSPDCDDLMSIMKSYHKLQKLSIRGWCREAQQRLQSVAEILQWSPSRLQELDLSLGGLQSESLSAIAMILSHQHELRSLDLSRNTKWLISSMTPHLASFLEALAGHSKLQSLDLQECRTSNETLTALLAALEKNTTMSTLKICADFSFDETAAGWFHCLPRLQNLRVLHGIELLLVNRHWFTVVLPILRRNTSLVELTYQNLGLDPATRRIVNRNRLLHATAEYRTQTKALPFSLWPMALHQLGRTGKVESSALFAFLQSNALHLKSGHFKLLSSCKRRRDS